MYLALFLFPWIGMYAISTMVMNHHALFDRRYGPGQPPFVVERDMNLTVAAPGARPADLARQLLASLDLEGSHAVSVRADGTLVVVRHDLLTPRRLTFTPSSGRLVIERQEPRVDAVLERFHRRRGYGTGYTLDTIWAASVDLVIVAMVFWVLSGLWMWWEMRVTRVIGAAALIGGVLAFAAFVVLI
jgi:hypothetical protein